MIHRHQITTIALISVCSFSWAQTPNEPKDLTTIRESYQEARAAAVAPVDKKYADALKTMMARLTKAGNLEGATAVQLELKKLQNNSTDETITEAAERATPSGTNVAEPDTKSLLRYVTGKEWKLNNGSGIRYGFNEDGVTGYAVLPGNENAAFTWEVTGKELIQTKGPGSQVLYFIFDRRDNRRSINDNINFTSLVLHKK